MKQNILLYAALLCIAAAVGFWFVPDANPLLYDYAYMGGGDTYEIVKNPADQITESEGYDILDGINRKGNRFTGASALPVAEAVKLEALLTSIEINAVSDQERLHPSEYSDDESLSPFMAACWNTGMMLAEKRGLYYSDRQEQEFASLIEQTYRQQNQMVLRRFVPRELTALRTHKINASGMWLLFSLTLFVTRRALRLGWNFQSMFGQKMVRVAPLSAIFAFALTGNIGVAQQLLNQYKKNDQQANEQPLERDSSNPDANPGRGNPPINSAPVDVHLEAWHDSDSRYTQEFVSVNQRLTKHLALTGIEQDIQTENGKAATANLALGFRVRLFSGVSLTLASGPQLEEKGKLAGKIDQLVTYSTFVVHKKLLDVVSINKFFTTVEYNTAPAHRHVLMVRAGPMPSWLYVMWEYKRSDGLTKEDFHGLQVNGKIFGAGNQWWKKALRGSYLYGYYDSVRRDWFAVSGYALDFSFR